MLTEEASVVLSAIYPEYVTVTYLDPMEGTIVTKVMYSNNNPASYLIEKDNGEYWDGIEFPLVVKDTICHMSCQAYVSNLTFYETDFTAL